MLSQTNGILATAIVIIITQQRPFYSKCTGQPVSFGIPNARILLDQSFTVRVSLLTATSTSDKREDANVLNSIMYTISY